MDARWATRLLYVVVGLWLVSGSIEVALAFKGEPLLPSPLNMVVFAGLSTATICLLVVRSHRGMAGRLGDTGNRVTAVGTEVVRLRKDVAAYKDIIERRDRDFTRRLDEMMCWMMRPVVPGRVRARATVALAEAPTQPLPAVPDEWEHELRGFIARETNTDDI